MLRLAAGRDLLHSPEREPKHAADAAIVRKLHNPIALDVPRHCCSTIGTLEDGVCVGGDATRAQREASAALFSGNFADDTIVWQIDDRSLEYVAFCAFSHKRLFSFH